MTIEGIRNTLKESWNIYTIECIPKPGCRCESKNPMGKI